MTPDAQLIELARERLAHLTNFYGEDEWLLTLQRADESGLVTPDELADALDAFESPRPGEGDPRPFWETGEFEALRARLAEFSANGSGPVAEPVVSFRSPEEVIEAAERFAAEHPPLLDGYVVPSFVSLLNGRFKGGKSTWTWALIEALVAGAESFCGRTCPGRTVPVVYLTEEPDGALAPKLARLRGRPVRVLNRAGLPSPRPPWSVTLQAAIAEAKASGAELLVVDTFAEWATVQDENAAPEVQAAVDVLRRATDAGLAVLLLHHFRKGWRAVLDEGEAGRGSTALLGAANVVVDLAKVEGGDARDRQLLGIGHLPSTPDALIVRWDGESYSVVSEGERGKARESAQHERVLAALPVSPPGMSVSELGEALEVSRTMAQRYAKAAFEALENVERTGDERAGFRYWQVPS